MPKETFVTTKGKPVGAVHIGWTVANERLASYMFQSSQQPSSLHTAAQGTVQGLLHPLHQILNWIVSGGEAHHRSRFCEHGESFSNSPVADETLVHLMSSLILCACTPPLSAVLSPSNPPL
uniref:Ephrin A5b n=1 Tax=Iconisemion striatum TaxID=60296 RepID=A0A1A7WEC5_9TELE